jgi:hypothetical protein
MSKAGNLFLLLSVSLLVAGCGAAQGRECAFRYDDVVRKEAAPFLFGRFGPDGIKYIDTEDPAISLHGHIAKVIFSATKSVVPGSSPWWEGAFVIEFDACTRKPLDRYDARW